MSVKGLDTCEELPVVADGDEDLHVGAHGGLEDAQGAGSELVLFKLRQLVLTVCRGSRSASGVAAGRRGLGENWGERIGELEGGGTYVSSERVFVRSSLGSC